jgi:hypothetical protein
MTKEEIIKAFEDQEVSIEEVAYGDILNPFPGLGKWKEVDSYGGEGQGETWWKVIHFKEIDTYIKINGFYTSYDGTNFDSFEDDLKVVEPRQKTITVYE